MKNTNLLLLILSVLTAQQIITKQYYTLTNEVIHLLDGMKEAMDGPAIWDIERVRWHMRRMHVGILNKKEKSYAGLYELDGKKYSIKELAYLEGKAEAANDQETLNKLVQIQDKAVHEFITFTEEFVDKTRDTKHLIFKLMEESCKLRDRMNSPILTWTETNGDEEKVFRKTNKNLRDMDKFFTHLNDFLGDLVKSCPKGYSQFKKILQNKKIGS